MILNSQLNQNIIKKPSTKNLNEDFNQCRTNANKEMKAIEPYIHLIENNSQKFQIPKAWIASVIYHESRGKRKALSPRGAMGLMQLMPNTAKELKVKNPWDAAQNIEGGTRYLKKMLNRFNGRIDLALAAYNAGPGNVLKYNGIPPFKETQNYVKSNLVTIQELNNCLLEQNTPEKEYNDKLHYSKDQYFIDFNNDYKKLFSKKGVKK